MVALETARSKKKAALKQEEPATAEDLPAKKEKKKKQKKKTRNGDAAAPTDGRSAGKTARTTANAVSLKTEGKDEGAEHKQGSKKSQKKKKDKRKSEDVTRDVIVIEDGASEEERGSAHGVKKKRKTAGRREEEEEGARKDRKKASEGISKALRISPGEKEAGTRRAGTQTENGWEVKTEEGTEVKTEEGTEVKTEEGTEVKTEEGTGKKKKKRKREELAGAETKTQEVPSSCNKKKKEKKREESSSGPADITMETAERKKKKKRKSSADPAKEGDDVIDSAEPANQNVAVSKPKEGQSEGADVKETKGKRSRKKRETGDKGACQEGHAPLKKTKKKKGEALVKIEREDSDTEMSGQVVFLSEKRGNTDEVTVNQARRVALQREVDLESHPKPQTSTAAGQWSSAQFDSSDQRDKFLRLMGGFKKASQPAAASGGRANMALGKEGQQSLQQRLLGEFERAQSRRMDFGGQGAGLGFSAPSNKKFFIDVNARRSVRFDD